MQLSSHQWNSLALRGRSHRLNAAKKLKLKRRFYEGQVGGERGIRTLEGLLTLTPLAGRAKRKHKSQYSLHYLTAWVFVL
jgi:hypothetical protein